MYSADKSCRVYCPPCWWSDGWNALDYGRDYDFSRPFFEQFNELWREVPLLGLSLDLTAINESPYCNHAGNIRKCYFLFDANYSEECLYGYYIVNSKNCVDSFFTGSCELTYDCVHAFKDYNARHMEWSIFCNDSSFLLNCKNCQNCFASVNLWSKHYHIFNKPYTKEEYSEKIKEFDLGSFRNYEEMKAKFREHALKYPVRTFWQDFSQNVSGLLVFESKNCHHCFEVVGGEDCKYCSFLQPKIRDCYDFSSWGDNAELIYEAGVVGGGARNIKFGEETGLGLYDATYVKLATSSSDLFGCISVLKKQYCILNKQYSKEDYEKLVPQIIEQMNALPYTDKQGRVYRYGEFFPPELSPFAYNETRAHQFFPLTKEETLAQGYKWKDSEPSQYKASVDARDLPDHIRDVKDSILEESIGCVSCLRAFRLIPQELAFYRRMNVPLPRKCFFCRLDEKIKDHPKPYELWKRKCQCSGGASENGTYKNAAPHFHGGEHCPNKFETSYSPERPEIVYCEACYQAEVV
ncbi:hypothetical protein HY504_01875 [Candidatus Wolfebacteria bacterium]|nr:hypothetical protein [Candidatus Wolfebacteria bacterium]